MAHDDHGAAREARRSAAGQPFEATSAGGVESTPGPRSTAYAFDRDTRMIDTAMPLERIARRPAHEYDFPRVGSMIRHYELLDQLGEGGMGTVYLARDTVTGRLVAIKVLRHRSGASAERFWIEAQHTARCRHDNIVAVHEAGEFEGYPYMVLEYLEGCTLRAWMTRGARAAAAGLAAALDTGLAPVAPDLAVELMLPVVQALACAHACGIVHCDLKPENIFLTRAGRVVVLDFGIARRLDADDVPANPPPARPKHDSMFGTLLYMSPEQVRSEAIDARSDLWSAGIVLYELVTGTHPLSHRSSVELLAIGDEEEPMPSVRDRCPGAGALGPIIDRCLRKPRDARYRSAGELLAALRRHSRRAGGAVMRSPRSLPSAV